MQQKKTKKSFWQVWGCEMIAACQQPSCLSHFWRDSSLLIIKSCYYSVHCQTLVFYLHWNNHLWVSLREIPWWPMARKQHSAKEKEEKRVSLGVQRGQYTHISLITTDCISVEHPRTLSETCCAFHLLVLFLFCFVLQGLSHSRPDIKVKTVCITCREWLELC